MANSSGKYSTAAIIGICGMLFFGTGTMISSKMMLDTSACPDWRIEEHKDIPKWNHGECPRYLLKKFEKPWYQTFVMFAAMMMCLIGHFGGIFYNDKKAKALAAAQARGEQLDVVMPTHVKHDWKAYTYIGVPALFDMAATVIMTYGLLFIDVSIMQMLRGAMVIFCSFFNIWCLKRKIRPYQWVAVCCTTTALILVGVSCVLSSSGSSAKSWDEQLLGCFLVVGSTAIQASQIVVEDFLLSKISAAPLQIVGMEGAWGLVVTVSVFWPIFSFAIPGNDHGHMEDIADTWYMFADSAPIVWFSIIYFISILFLNWAGMVVTQQTSSVVRTIFEAVRTAFIWIVNLLIFYVFAKDSVYGERWTTYSWLQLAGFMLLTFASQMYSGYVKFPQVFKYKFEDEKKAVEEKAPLLDNGDELLDEK